MNEEEKKRGKNRMCFDRHVATEEKTHTHTQPLTVVILDVRHYASFHSVLPEKILCSGKEAKKKQPLSRSFLLLVLLRACIDRFRIGSYFLIVDEK